MNASTTGQLRRQVEMSERWVQDADSGPLLGHCKKLLLEAEDLEAAGSAWRSGGLNPAVLECFGTALNSLATVALLLDQAQDGPVAQRDEHLPDPSHLLSAVNQNLRFAAEAAALAGEVLGEEIRRLS